MAFTERLAHDLRTPLTVIQEYAALMREGLVGDLNDEQQGVLDVISDRVYDLNRMVDNAMDAAKLAAKSHRIWGRPCSLHDIVARIRLQLERKAAVRRVDLKFRMSSKGPDIHCDEEEVGRAIANIVAAALNLSRDGCRMSISEELDPGLREAGIRVTVEGAGVDAIATLFRDLAKVEPSTRENWASQLCGASLAAELIDRNLGSLTMAPLDGSAAALWIGLPIADPFEILRRHLARVTQHHPRVERTSLFRAVAFETVDKQSSRDVCSLLNSSVGRDDLAVEFDSTHWLLAVVRRRVRTEALRRRIERRREAFNRTRLGRPLPQISLQSLGSWLIPIDVAGIVATLERRSEQRVPAGACAD
ncbi:MAG TPA: histidine kinase dimerization/phospho-acceptor domain-containing protein [Planctomycetaceae bacterium]|nr:histidine kinase dimerization/phospho-acceptor domain-containing protein [Planctomycetaceae bacterium]